jgi:hypothetical protein
MYKCKHFKIFELTDPVIYKANGENAFAFFTEEIKQSIDAIREFFDRPVTVNNWIWGGQFQWRGLRSSMCNVGSLKSQHRIVDTRLCNAIDFDVKDLTAEQVRQEILNNQNIPSLRFITRMEKDVNWVHIDCKPLDGQERIYMFRG